MKRLTFLVTLLLALLLFELNNAACADSITIVVTSVRVENDASTGKLVLALKLAPAKSLSGFSQAHLARPVELYQSDKLVLTSIFREPIIGRSMRVSGGGWTRAELVDIAKKLANPFNGAIELGSKD